MSTECRRPIRGEIDVLRGGTMVLDRGECPRLGLDHDRGVGLVPRGDIAARGIDRRDINRLNDPPLDTTDHRGTSVLDRAEIGMKRAERGMIQRGRKGQRARSAVTRGRGRDLEGADRSRGRGPGAGNRGHRRTVLAHRGVLVRIKAVLRNESRGRVSRIRPKRRESNKIWERAL